jgi:pimeloyl-ACP methyl ester carboxylesterase
VEIEDSPFSFCVRVGLMLVLLACAGDLANPFHAIGGVNSPYKPIPCASLRTLRDLGQSLNLFTNIRTADQIEYVVVGDGKVSDDLIVMFNGTEGILPDWPIQMITNGAASPKIVKTQAYDPLEDGPISLCRDYRLVLFDYPGVGQSPLSGNVTFDRTANDVDAMLTSIGKLYHLQTNSIVAAGWSLGTAYALKYAFVAPKVNPARIIRDLVLIATKPGGNTDAFVDGNQGPCVSTIFNFRKDNPNISTSFKKELQMTGFDLLFPYLGEPPYNGPTIDCTATINSTRQTVKLNVVPICPSGSECQKNEAVQAANRLAWPWSLTQGVDQNLFSQQRELDADYSLCYCATASSDFTSVDCSCSGSAPEMSSSNGGVCQTVSTGATQPNAPISTSCVELHTGPITVINGPEDLYIQHTYGEELVTAYQQIYGPDRASIVTYPGVDGAGHGVLLMHPMWTQQQIYDAIK